tara:strand:+ start:7239 stop:8894 length:1656 start_codon:yes stop_codon:yes gene_type:complete
MYDLKSHQTESKMVAKGPCDCGSSDGNVEYDDGHKYCFVCHQFTKGDGKTISKENNVTNIISNGSLPKGTFEPITDRAISRETAVKYGVTVDMEGGVIKQHHYPYFDDSYQVAVKSRRCVDKHMWSSGNIGSATMFGQHLFNKGSKYITITEGEVDAMSVYELTGSKYPVVSIKNGSSGAAKDCKQNFEYLNSFETIVICMDNDEAGHKAEAAIAALFEPNKCKIIKMALKDPNEYLVAGKRSEFVDCWWRAAPYTPAGIVNLRDIGDALYDEGNQHTVLYPWEGLNTMLYGIRTGELVTLTAGTGTGKSSVIRELMHHIMDTTDDNIGVLSLEENVKQTCWHLMSVAANARLNIREVRETYSREQLKVWEAEVLGSGQFFAFDHFGSLDNDEILNRVRYMIKALDCRWIMIDHLSILVSGQEGNDERKSIDILMTKLRSLVEETQCGLLLVSHLRRTSSDKGAEDGKEVSIGHLRGSQAIAQLSDAVIAMERNQQAEEPAERNRTTMRVLKNRYAGLGGIATYLTYDKDTGRLHETDAGDEDGDYFAPLD